MASASAYRRQPGAAPLLFERLVSCGPRRHSMADADALLRSLRSEIEDLFNTRSPLPIDRIERRSRTAIDYGIPDLSAFPLGEHAAVARLARHLEGALLAYEPRLEAPDIAIRGDPRAAGGAIAVIAGNMRIDKRLVPVSFEIPLTDRAMIHDAG